MREKEKGGRGGAGCFIRNFPKTFKWLVLANLALPKSYSTLNKTVSFLVEFCVLGWVILPVWWPGGLRSENLRFLSEIAYKAHTILYRLRRADARHADLT